ncbi:MAG: hypothetical protein Q3980_10905 [Turicibacter sp.]|nr:hypothetical protein [Turicibacter sp.]
MLFVSSLLIMILIFIGVFFFLIQSKKLNFNNKKRILQFELAINLIITLILLIISGLGITMYFIFMWLIISAICYYLYCNNHEKYGFIGSSFCTFFFSIFLILQLWIYGTAY